jgi:glycine oxidase
MLRATSSRMFPDLTKELLELTGIDNGYRVCGGVEILPTEIEIETIATWYREGVAFRVFKHPASARNEPLLRVTGDNVYELPGMAQVRNPWHLRALIEACSRWKIRLVPQTPIRHLEHHANAITGVCLQSGELKTAGKYVIAAGAWSELLLKPLGIATGIHPVRGQIVLLKSAAPLIRRIVLVGKNYLVPREDGHVLIGATEEPEAGFAKQNTARAVANLIEFGTSLVPELAQAELVKCWAGLRPGSLDNLPSLGAAANYRNLYVASGHFRAGVQLSPATAQVMTELIMGRTPSIPLDDFQPGRQAGPPFRTAFRS